MALQIHSKLGPYEILAPLGAGGMGEVYRARDTRLDRTVAIKILPAAVASQPDVRERFEREARAVAALNHPHICVLHDVGRQGGIDFIVMEFLEGETLESRLARGPLSLNEALRFAAEIADALDKAHRQGITHRDLKPGNVMITKSGTKLLDFGLAKLQTPSGISSNSAMPTNQSLTAQGTIIGTLQYMAPEQLEGVEADPRTDVFAFGALVYEMVTGKRAFEGKSQVSLMTAIMANQPAPIASLQPMTPSSLDALVSGCLAKSPDDRWQSMRDVHRQLEWIRVNVDDGRNAAKTDPPSTRRLRAGIGVVIVLSLLAGAGLAWLTLRGSNPAAAPVYTGITAPAKAFDRNPHPVISPDGKQVAFCAPDAAGNIFLWVRALESQNARLLPGTDAASFPFWSPDSHSVGFFSGGKLKRVDLSGGAPQSLADIANFVSGAWSTDGTILFSPGYTQGLLRVAMSGGKIDTVKAPGEVSYDLPNFLPDGRHFLMTGTDENGGVQIFAGSLDSPEVKLLPIDARSRAAYAAGYVFYGHDRNLMAQPFDAQRLTTTGDPVRVLDNLGFSDGSTVDYGFSVSAAGVLVSWSGDYIPLGHWLWLDREGQHPQMVGNAGGNTGFDVSREGSRAAYGRIDPQTNLWTIWLMDLGTGAASPLVAPSKPAFLRSPFWSPDGNVIAYATGNKTVYFKALRGTDRKPLLLNHFFWLQDWSRYGDYLVYTEESKGTGDDISILPLLDDGKPMPYLHTAANEYAGRISPDSHWLAYVSDQSGKLEVYVNTFPRPQSNSEYQISFSGGSDPVWRKDGKELYYISADDKLMAVGISLNGPKPEISKPKTLFTMPKIAGLGGYPNYAVSDKGDRFLFNAVVDQPGPQTIDVLLNWPSLLKKR